MTQLQPDPYRAKTGRKNQKERELEIREENRGASGIVISDQSETTLHLFAA